MVSLLVSELVERTVEPMVLDQADNLVDVMVSLKD